MKYNLFIYSLGKRFMFQNLIRIGDFTGGCNEDIYYKTHCSIKKMCIVCLYFFDVALIDKHTTIFLHFCYRMRTDFSIFNTVNFESISSVSKYNYLINNKRR